MTETCTFCKIVRREETASIVYEDEKAMAFLSNRPVNTGHTLVIPKRHYENIFEIPTEEAAHLFKIVKNVASAVKKSENAEGIRIVQNNGEAAGQVIFHLHVHIIPMYAAQPPLHHREIRESSTLENDAKRIRQFL
jgi:histidine triad (HIT) family protein